MTVAEIPGSVEVKWKAIFGSRAGLNSLIVKLKDLWAEEWIVLARV